MKKFLSALLLVSILLISCGNKKRFDRLEQAVDIISSSKYFDKS